MVRQKTHTRGHICLRILWICGLQSFGTEESIMKECQMAPTLQGPSVSPFLYEPLKDFRGDSKLGYTIIRDGSPVSKM